MTDARSLTVPEATCQDLRARQMVHALEMGATRRWLAGEPLLDGEWRQLERTRRQVRRRMAWWRLKRWVRRWW